MPSITTRHYTMNTNREERVPPPGVPRSHRQKKRRQKSHAKRYRPLYFKVYDFMISTCHLSGNRLLLFALIHSYTENGQTLYARQDSIAARIGISRQSANRALKELEQKGLITECACENGVAYKSNIETAAVKKCDSSLSKNATAAVKKCDRPLYTKTHKKIDNNNAPSFSIEKYEAYVNNLELKYERQQPERKV